MLTADTIDKMAENWGLIAEQNSKNRWAKEVVPTSLADKEIQKLFHELLIQDCAQYLQLWRTNELCMLEWWCSEASKYVNRKKMPPEAFFLILIRLIDQWAIERKRRNVNSPYWRADCLQGMFRNIKPDKSKRQVLKANFEAFQAHLLDLCGVPPNFEPVSMRVLSVLAALSVGFVYYGGLCCLLGDGA